jgi:hypothetical protein
MSLTPRQIAHDGIGFGPRQIAHEGLRPDTARKRRPSADYAPRRRSPLYDQDVLIFLLRR